MSNRENFEDTISKNEHVVHHDVQDVNREQNEYKTPQKNVPNDASDDARNNKRPRSNSEPTGLNISPNKFKTTKKAKTIRRTKSNSVTHMHYVKDGSSNGNNNLDSVQEGDGVQDDSITIDDDDVPPVLEPEYVGEYWKPYWSSDGQHKDSKGKEVDHVAGEEVDVNDCDVEHPYHYDSKYYNEIHNMQTHICIYSLQFPRRSTGFQSPPAPHFLTYSLLIPIEFRGFHMDSFVFSKISDALCWFIEFQ